MRVFVGFDLTSEPRREIEKLLKKLQKKHWKVKWEKPEKIHLTLAFLGNIKEKQLDLVRKACQEAVRILKQDPDFHQDDGGGPVQSDKKIILSFKGLGCFPDYEWPRIIWLGLKGDLKSLASLQKNLRDRLENLGFKTEKRSFEPHLTLGRIKKARARERREIGRQIKGMRKIDFKSQWLVDGMVIYESKPGTRILARGKCLAGGYVYRKVAEIPFYPAPRKALLRKCGNGSFFSRKGNKPQSHGRKPRTKQLVRGKSVVRGLALTYLVNKAEWF